MFFINKLKTIAFMVILIYVSLNLYGYFARPIVELYPLSSGRLIGKVSASGEAKINQTNIVSSRVDGLIKDINFEVGDRVRKGEIVMTIDTRDILLEIQKAKANIGILRAERAKFLSGSNETQQARIDFEKAEQNYFELRRKLAKKSNVNEAENSLKSEVSRAEERYLLSRKRLSFLVNYDLAIIDEKIKQAELMLETAENKFSDSNIKSPFDGTITEKDVSKGLFVTTGTPLFKISDLDNIKISAMVDEADILNIRAKQKAEITGKNLHGLAILGEVFSINPTPIESEKTNSGDIKYSVEISLKKDPNLRLNEGMSVDVNIFTVYKENVLLVPITALIENKKQYLVFVYNQDKAYLKKIGIGAKNYKFAEVISGLKAGDLIIDNPDRKMLNKNFVRLKVKDLQ